MSDDFIEDIIVNTEPDEESSEKIETTNDLNPEADIDIAASVNDTDIDTSPTNAAVADLAKKLGWNPDHQSDSFVDAETYILKSKDIQSSMKDHNKDLKNQLADMKESLEALQIHNERVYRAEVTRLEAELADLNQKKDAAIEVGDVEEVKNIDKKIDSVKTTIAEPVVKPQKSTSNPAYDAWIKDNKWYIEEPEMAAYADQVAQQYIGAPADRVYTAVRNKVAELWPDKFNTAVNSVNPKSTVTKPIVAPNPVEGGHKQPTSGKFTKVDLTDSQRSMMTQFAKMGIMTEAQYISDIAKLQGEK